MKKKSIEIKEEEKDVLIARERLENLDVVTEAEIEIYLKKRLDKKN